MHTMLAVAAAYERYRDMPASNHHQTSTKTYHSAQCVLLSNQKLSYIIDLSDRDPIWATVPSGTFGKLAFEFQISMAGLTPFSIQNWMKSTDSGNNQDLLTKFNVEIDQSLGGLETALENTFERNRAVPSFEFREFPVASSPVFQTWAEAAEQDIIYYHKGAQAALRAQRLSRRDSSVYSITSAPTPTPTPQYQFITTYTNGEVIECATDKVADFAGVYGIRVRQEFRHHSNSSNTTFIFSRDWLKSCKYWHIEP
jgi:hypothetical protein